MMASFTAGRRTNALPGGRRNSCPRRRPTDGAPALSRQPAASAGARSAHGSACSSWPASRRASPRPTAAPTSCAPTGRPSSVQWSGREIAGCPVMLANAVKATVAMTASPGRRGRRAGPRARRPRPAAVIAIVGVRSTSKSRPQRRDHLAADPLEPLHGVGRSRRSGTSSAGACWWAMCGSTCSQSTSSRYRPSAAAAQHDEGRDQLLGDRRDARPRLDRVAELLERARRCAAAASVQAGSVGMPQRRRSPSGRCAACPASAPTSSANGRARRRARCTRRAGRAWRATSRIAAASATVRVTTPSTTAPSQL